MSGSGEGDMGTAARRARLRQVVDDCLCRRGRGEKLADEQITSEHPDLLPDLLQELHKLSLIGRARDQVAADSMVDGSSGASEGALGSSTDVGLTLDASSARAAEAAPLPQGYQLVREIGRGGQAVVYQAIQTATKRSVALKLLHHHEASAPSGIRFQREVEILARLNHPNIVQVYDSGQFAGRSYVVMDYVAGLPLQDWSADLGIWLTDRAADPIVPTVRGAARAPAPHGRRSRWRSGIRHPKAAVREIVRLFVKVCNAVNAAHLQGVIHRDLKPSNIRIDLHDEPHILDFGLARAERGDAGGGGLDEHTLTGQFVGSLPWASPEQTEGDPGGIDIRTDVYSLGVVLYQMLTGRFPYAVHGAPRMVLDAICTMAPTPPGKHARWIDDDLSTIVLTCLSKRPERRYQNAGDLGRDLQRYLRGEPIEAKRDSPLYVLRKTLWRYRLAVGMVAAFVVVLLASTVVAASLYRQARRERDQARNARNAAERQAAKAGRIQGFLQDMFKLVDPVRAQGVDTTILQRMFDDAAGRLSASLGADSDVEAAVRETIGLGYLSIDRLSDAEAQLAETLRLNRSLYGDDDASVARCHDHLARAILSQGRLAEAEPLLQQAVAIERRLPGPARESLAFRLSTLGTLLRESGRLAEAEQVFREAVEILRGQRSPGSGQLPAALIDLASVLQARERLTDAGCLLDEALALTAGPDADQSTRLVGLNNRALLARTLGDFDQAEALLRQALQGTQRYYGDDHSETATALLNLGALLYDRRHDAEGENYVRQAVAIRERVFGAAHAKVASALQSMAGILLRKSEPGGAEQASRRAVSILQTLYPAGHPDTASALAMLGDCLTRLDRGEDAEACLTQAAELQGRLLGQDHSNLASTLRRLGVLQRNRGDLEAAQCTFERALAIVRSRMGDDHLYTGICSNELAVVLQAKGGFDSAEPLFERSLAIDRKVHGLRHVQVAVDLCYLARNAQCTDRFDRAREFYEQALDQFREFSSDQDHWPLRALVGLGEVLLRQGEVARAEELLFECASRATAAGAAGSRYVPRAQSLLGACLVRRGALEEAELLLRNSYDELVAYFGSDDNDSRDARQRLVELYEAWGKPQLAAQFRRPVDARSADAPP